MHLVGKCETNHMHVVGRGEGGMWDNIYLRISELSCTLEGLGNSNREVREINILVLWCRELGLGAC